MSLYAVCHCVSLCVAVCCVSLYAVRHCCCVSLLLCVAVCHCILYVAVAVCHCMFFCRDELLETLHGERVAMRRAVGRGDEQIMLLVSLRWSGVQLGAALLQWRAIYTLSHNERVAMIRAAQQWNQTRLAEGFGRLRSLVTSKQVQHLEAIKVDELNIALEEASACQKQLQAQKTELELLKSTSVLEELICARWEVHTMNMLVLQWSGCKLRQFMKGWKHISAVQQQDSEVFNKGSQHWNRLQKVRAHHTLWMHWQGIQCFVNYEIQQLLRTVNWWRCWCQQYTKQKLLTRSGVAHWLGSYWRSCLDWWRSYTQQARDHFRKLLARAEHLEPLKFLNWLRIHAWMKRAWQRALSSWRFYKLRRVTST